MLLGVVAAGLPAGGLSPRGAAQDGSTTAAPGADRASYDQLAPAADDGRLKVISLLPSGRLDAPEQASEIRIQFDRPVIALAVVDQRPAAERFVTISPPLAGTFRWASTRLLVFTPAAPVGWGRRHTVTVQGVTTPDGLTMAKPATASFETPVPVCDEAGLRPRPDGSAVVALRCRTAIDATSVVANARVTISPNALALDPFAPPGTVPADLAAILDRLRRSGAEPPRTFPVTRAPAADPELCRPDTESDTTCVFLQTPVLPAEKKARVAVLAGTRALGGTVGGRGYDVTTFETATTPLIGYSGCRTGCDPGTPPQWSVAGAGFDELALDGRLTVTDLTSRRVQTYRVPAGVRASGDLDALADELRDPLSLRWAALAPRRSYRVRVAPDAVDLRGRRLGYAPTWELSFGKRSAAFEGPRGERVLEAAAPALVGYSVRNLDTYERVLVRLDADAIVRLAPRIAGGPGLKPVDPTAEGRPVTVKLTDRPDVTRLTAARLGPDGRPGVWLLAVREARRQPGTTYGPDGSPRPDPSSPSSTSTGSSKRTGSVAPRWYTSLVQHTDLGVSIRRAPGNALVAVTAIGSAAPVAGAEVTMKVLGGEAARTLWTGTTDAAGLATIGPEVFRDCSRCDLLVLVTKGADLAYAQSRWREWGTDLPSETSATATTDTTGTTGTEATAAADLPPPLPAGRRYLATMFSDRGVYRLGEEVKLKGIVRIDDGRGLVLPEGLRRLRVEVTDNTDTVIVARTVTVSALGSFDLAATIPPSGRQGSYYARVVGIDGGADWLVTAFRNPDFKVDVTLGQRSYVPGDRISATVEGSYLFGAPMADAPVTWTVTPSWTTVSPGTGPDAPPALRLDTFRFDYLCVDWGSCDATSWDRLAGDDGAGLDARGRLELGAELPVVRTRHRPVLVVAEAQVTDVNRQAIANRASAVAHPGEHYVGVRMDRSFVAVGGRLTGSAVAVTPTGRPVPGVRLTARLVRWEYVTAKRQTSDSTTTTEGRWVPTEVATQSVASALTAVPFGFTTDRTGYYEVRVTSSDRRGNWVEASTDAYVTGPGYVAWETPGGSEGSLTLVPERPSYRVGETARILVQSPWEQAEALVSTEGSLVFGARRVAVRGSSAVIEVPVTDEHVPNVLVAVTLYKGRTAAAGSAVDDPGRPMIRASAVSIEVPTTERALSVDVRVPRPEERPGASTSVSVLVKDAAGRPVPGEATIWAVDEGVLRLTGWTAPDLLAALVQRRWDQTALSDSRMLLLSPVSAARAQLSSEKGDGESAFSEAPGGGGDASPSAKSEVDEQDTLVRRDFRTLAVWSAAVPVGADGRASTAVKLPEQLTEFRVVAVAASGAQLFGSGSTSVRTASAFSVNPAMPRFVTPGDRVEGGVVVQNRTGGPASVTVSARMIGTSSPLTIEGPATVTRQVPVGATEIRFTFRGSVLGTARIRFDGSLRSGTSSAVSDAVEITVPVSIARRPEVVAASGEVVASAAGTSAEERLEVPADALPGSGALDLTTSTSALAGLQAGIENLVQYPYGCLEQRTSRLKVLLALRALGRQWTLPALPLTRLDQIIGQELAALRTFQTFDGGLTYWPGDGRTDLYLTSRTLVMLMDAREQGVTLPVGLVGELTRFLQRQLENLDRTDGPPSVEDSLRWNRTEVVYALARAGAPERATMEALYRDRLELTTREQLALLRAMLESGLRGTMPTTLYSQIRNSLRLEGNRAALDGERYATVPCWCIAYLLADDTHLTAELLSIVVRADPKDPLAAALARELVARRSNGTWRNTLEDGYALTALVDYGRLAERVTPDLDLQVVAGATTLLRQRWSGRSLEAKTQSTPLAQVPGGGVPLRFTATGTGRVSYTARLTYARPLATLKALDQGFSVVRSYSRFTQDVGAGTRPATTAAGRNQARSSAGTRSFAPGDVVRVTVSVSTAQVRTNVVVEDPLPAGFEAIDARLATSSQELQDQAETGADTSSSWAPGIDRVEIRDDRVLLFATRLEPGELRYTYLARATAPGTFSVAPAQASEMYRPELFGRTAATTVTVG